jgi:hypothetical protein
LRRMFGVILEEVAVVHNISEIGTLSVTGVV